PDGANLSLMKHHQNSWFNFLIPSTGNHLDVGGTRVPLLMVRNVRARRYVLRLRLDATARVPIPCSGSVAEARRSAVRNLSRLEVQLKRLPVPQPIAKEWRQGCEILFRGELVRLEADGNDGKAISFGSEKLQLSDPACDLRPAVQGHLRRLAEQELPLR